MSLTDILNEALDSAPDARFAGLVASDGLSVEMAYADDDEDLDLELAELELATLTASASAASARIGSGLVRGLTLETEDLTYLAALVTPGYFAVLGLHPEGDLGQARFTVSQMIDRMKEEL